MDLETELILESLDKIMDFMIDLEQRIQIIEKKKGA